MAKQGRPRGLNVNPYAIDLLLDRESLSKSELCSAAGIKPGHLTDMLRRQKGASPAVVRRMALALHCQPEVIAPELSGLFISVRPGDDEAVA